MYWKYILALTQSVDVVFHLAHPHEHSLLPDGVIAVCPLEPLRMRTNLPLNGAEVQQTGSHHEGEE